MAPQAEAADASSIAVFQKDPPWRLKYLQEAVGCIRADPTATDKKPGYLYATQETKEGFVKIGYSQDKEAKRPEALHQCGLEFVQVYYTTKFNWAFKCEQIVHKLLFEFGHSLRSCGRGRVKEQHFEWYKLDFLVAISAINLVMNWILRDPYERLLGDNFLAQLTREWKHALQEFEESQKTSHPHDWSQFFGGDTQHKLDLSPWRQMSNLPDSPQHSSLLYFDDYTTPEGRLVPRQRSSTSRRHRPRASFSPLTRDWPLTPSKSVGGHQSTTRAPRLDRSQTVSPRKHSQRDRDSSEFLTPSVTPSKESFDQTTFSPLQTKTLPTVPVPLGSKFSGGLRAKGSSKSSDRAPGIDPLISKTIAYIPDTYTIKRNSGITERSPNTIKRDIEANKRNLIRNADCPQMPYPGGGLAVVGPSNNFPAGPEPNGVLSVDTESDYEYETVQLTDNDTYENGSGGGIEIEEGPYKYNNRHAAEDHINHLQLEGKRRSREMEGTECDQQSESRIDHGSPRSDFEDDDDDLADSKASFHSAPTSPVKDSVPDSALSPMIHEKETKAEDKSRPAELERAPLTVVYGINNRTSSVPQDFAAGPNLDPLSPSIFQGWQQLQVDLEAEWPSPSSSQWHAASSPTLSSVTTEESLITSQDALLQPANPDISWLIERIAALRIDDNDSCGKYNERLPKGSDSLRDMGKDGQSQSKNAVPFASASTVLA